MLERQIDHIVYSVPNMEEAMDWFEAKIGVRPVFGGYHTAKGTKNALLHLGNGCYLEILAIDEANENIETPRWMGVDLIERPRMTRWCLKSSNLAMDSNILKNYNPVMGKISGGERKTTSGALLKWEMILPLAAPEVEIIPFMTDWQLSSFHPTEQLEQHCELLKMVFVHPNAKDALFVFDELGLDVGVRMGEEGAIFAKIETQKGVVWI